MVLMVILILLLSVLIYLLMVPLVICIDTTSDLYYLKIKGLLKAQVLGDADEVVKIQLRILFMNFYIYPLRQFKLLGSGKKKKKARGGQKRSFNLKKGLRLLKSFKIKRFLLDVDTGDFLHNAKLYPVFALLNFRYGGFMINYEDRNRLVVELQNRPINLIKAFINN